MLDQETVQALINEFEISGEEAPINEPWSNLAVMVMVMVLPLTREELLQRKRRLRWIFEDCSFFEFLNGGTF
ncbi:hypothetical protein L1987_66563 [Smallanthus sonchifolius]|uniref:Uncharacterized protein n=1 Tax=Smallanthus sonchifolius TaxID=185202 RepID=A0ACB9BXU8_9ASTR|nr:hypothetical protein L1987_66563 [Smallanthus sonchifolius]